MRPRCFLLVLIATSATFAARRAAADSDTPLVHPIYAKLPDLAEDDFTRRAFTAATARYKLAPLEIIDVPAAPTPRAPELIKAAVSKTMKLAFDEALPDFDGALAELETSGGAGLSTSDLGDLFLFRGMAIAHADWKAPAGTDAASIGTARTQAFADYARAAVLTPARVLNPREIPPQVVADFARAVAEARQQPRATLLVRGDADATVSLDGAAPLRIAGGVTVRGRRRAASTSWPVGGAGPRRAGARRCRDFGTGAVRGGDPRAARRWACPTTGSPRTTRAAWAALSRSSASASPAPAARVELRLVDLSGAKRDAALVSTTGRRARRARRGRHAPRRGGAPHPGSSRSRTARSRPPRRPSISRRPTRRRPSSCRRRPRARRSSAIRSPGRATAGPS